MSVTTSCTCYSWERPAQDHAPSCPAAPRPTHPTPPPGDNGTAEAREQIADDVSTAVHIALERLGGCRCGESGRLDCADIADAVLDVPAVAEGLAAAETLQQRVEAIPAVGTLHGAPVVALADLRRALDGEP